MPELPEVETVVRGLNEHLVGHSITSFDFDWPKTIKTPIEIFKKEIEGSRVLSAERRGKLIIINLSSGHSILIHLKMTGQLVWVADTSRQTSFRGRGDGSELTSEK